MVGVIHSDLTVQRHHVEPPLVVNAHFTFADGGVRRILHLHEKCAETGVLGRERPSGTGAIQTTMLRAHTAGLFKAIPQGLPCSMEPHRGIRGRNAKRLGYLCSGFTTQINPPD
jgi:hypothetical protein